jgi:hypothetical protein
MAVLAERRAITAIWAGAAEATAIEFADKIARWNDSG